MPLEDPDEGPRRPPPDPLDRLWVHPSELPAVRGTRPTARARRDWPLVVAAGVAGALLTVGVLAAVGLVGSRSATSRPSAAARSVAALAAGAAPSVVAVIAAGAAGPTRGSGVTVDHGWVLTSCDAVVVTDRVTVTTSDGGTHTATVRGCDRETDLALLRVDGVDGGFSSQTRGPVRVGETVVAMGAADGARTWVAAGVVSSVAAVVVGAGTPRPGLIATDALVGAAAPGGALLDSEGRLVGVLTAGAGGGGVAVPVVVARDVADQLRHTGRAQHGWLGVGGSDALDRPGGGVRVESVATNGPAARAGVVAGDVIIAVGDRPLSDMGDLMGDVRQRHPGDRTTMRLWRAGDARTVVVELGATPDSSTTTTSATTAPGRPVVAAVSG